MAPTPPVHPADPFDLMLAAAALEPGLRSLLVFDVPMTLLAEAADRLRAFLEVTTAQQFELFTLLAADEDELWGGVALEDETGQTQVRWRPGRLAQVGVAARPRLVLVPDLTRLTLPALRATTMLLDAPVANLERHGYSAQWHPQLCWLAGCPRGAVGEVSAHVLDRFALRPPNTWSTLGTRAIEVRSWANGPEFSETVAPTLLPEPTRQWLSQAVARQATVSPDALEQLASYFAGKPPTHRRELALLRLSRALARLAGDADATSQHVDDAARLCGLSRNVDTPRSEQREVEATVHRQTAAAPDQLLDTENASVSVDPSVMAGSAQDAGEAVFAADAEQLYAAAALPPDPFPEDNASPQREADSLRLPPHCVRAHQDFAGLVIGTRVAARLEDLALVSTILEAAKFQKVRLPATKGTRQLRINRADLRSYRRAPSTQLMLVLVLDYTCLPGTAWEEAVLPHLSWAYAARASICLVQVGAHSARNYLRAEQLSVRNLLHPRLAAALRETAGTATPLAHGLDLALRATHAALEHGRSHVHRARLVVLTDGRGNVPLAVSRAGALSGAVNREGVEDALAVAQALRRLRRVTTFFLDPQPPQCADLPRSLAAALNATARPVAHVPRFGGVP